MAEEEDSGVPSRASKSKGTRGAPAWIVTFADLSTLMLTFFVLMLSFANTDIEKFKNMLGSVQNAFGVTKEVKGDYQSVLKGEGGKSANKVDSAQREQEELHQMAGEVQKTIEEANQSENVSVSVGPDGVRVRIKGGYLFAPGDASLKSEALPFLKGISRIMKKFPFKLKVEGHTDNIPIHTTYFASNWELSAIRATTVLRFFSEKEGIEKIRLTAVGYADNRPLTSNDTAEGRGKNRRVEFVIKR